MRDDLERLEKQAMGLSINERRELAMQLIWSLPRNDVVLLTERLSKTLQKDIIATLPAEISFLILSKLKLEDLLKCTLVSRTWAARCQDQALWAKKCVEHNPPIHPAQTTWADISTHRTTMYPPPPPDPITDDGLDGDEYDYDPISSQGGMGGGGGIGPRPHYGWGGLRRSVWERSTPSILPSFSAGASSFSHSLTSPSRAADQAMGRKRIDPASSHLDSPDSIPTVNYKHLFIVHEKLLKRKRYSVPVATLPRTAGSTASIPSTIASTSLNRVGAILPKKLDAVSSIQAGGLPGHSEIIYALQLIRHRMDIKMTKEEWEGGAYDTLMTLSHLERGPKGHVPVEPTISGRNWLLSTSRDRTMRLWSVDAVKPKVVKVFHDGHEGSILTLIAIRIPNVVGDGDESMAPSGKAKIDEGKLIAVTGGSDGRLCLWDVEHGDGTPEKIVQAHSDSVLCVRGDSKRIVSCSKDRTVQVHSLPDMVQTLCIRVEMINEHTQGVINAVGISDDYIVAGAGDRSLRVWSIHTGEQLAQIQPHDRGIASVSFDPMPPRSTQFKTKYANGRIVGTIATGSSDASVKIFSLVAYPYRKDKVERISFEEMMEEDRTIDAELGLGRSQFRQQDEKREQLSLAIEKRMSCAAPCCCPPGLARLEGKRCGRCLNRGHMELVRSVSLDRDVLLSGSYDGSVRIWDRDTGRALANLAEGHSGRVCSVVGDKVRIASSGSDSKIMLWDFGQGLDTSFIEP